MQRHPKTKLYKKLFICSAIVFAAGLILAFIGLFGLYGSVEKCGFGAGTCSGANTRATITTAGSIIAVISFYMGFICALLFLIARSKEKQPRA